MASKNLPAVQVPHKCKVHPDMEFRIKTKQVHDIMTHWLNTTLLNADAPPVKVTYLTEDIGNGEWTIRVKLEDFQDA